MSDYSIEPAWLDDPKTYEKVRAVRELTANCPCAGCQWESTCKTECPKFNRWCKTGRAQR